MNSHERRTATPNSRSELRARSNADPGEMGLPNPSTEEAHNFELREETRRKPIVSINGRDVDEDELTRGAA
jgi:hypothetical protein